MSRPRSPHGGVPVLLASAVLALCAASAAGADIPRQSARHCTVGQKTLRLEPLQIRTVRGTYRFQVEMAVTARSQEIGLMCRRSVAADRGMLFDYPRPQPVAFWMRNTITSLDIIYIGADGRVITIARNATPLSEEPIPSYGAVRGVLELRAGRAAEIGLMPGDRVYHRFFPRG